MKPKDLALLFVLSGIWGSAFIMIKMGIESYSPAHMTFIRLVMGSVFLGAMAYMFKAHIAKPEHRLPLLGIALLGAALPFTFFAWGEQSVPSYSAAVINATTPLWTVFLSMWMGEAALKPKQMVGVVLGFVGVVIAISESLHQGFGSPLGLFLIALASFFYALSAMINKRYLKGVSAYTITFYQLMFAAFLMLPTLPFAESSHPTLKATLAVVFLGLVSSGLSHLIYYNILARVHAAQASSVLYLLPVWGLFWGYVAGEPVSWVSLSGVCVILLGMWLLS